MKSQIRVVSDALRFISFLFLAGCGTQYAYHQTESDIRGLKGLSVESFIRDKIIDSDPAVSKAILAVFEPLSKVVSTIHGDKSIQEEFSYRKENFIYKALFDYRYHALTKPKRDLELFCKINNGALQMTAINTTNLASTSGIFLNPLEAYMNVMKSNVGGLKSEIKIAPDITIPIYFSKEDIAHSYAEIIERRNQRSGIYKAEKSIDLAISEESFGQFSCIKNDKKLLWSVNIMPLVLERSDSIIRGESFYIMYIGVVPLKEKP